MTIDSKGVERRMLYEFARETLRGVPPARRILDVACGPGEGAFFLALGLPEREITALDIDESAIQTALERFRFPNLRFEAGDARKMRWPDASFDAIVSFHTIEHFGYKGQTQFLSELARLIRPKGTLLIATPDRRVWALQGIAGLQPDHLRELDQEEFIALVSASGFRVTEHFGQGILKEGKFFLRRFLNVLRRLDVLRLRRLIGRAQINAIDQKTQPVELDLTIQRLAEGERAAITVLVCEKP